MNKTILPLLAIATLSQLVGISGISEIRQASAQSIIPANDLGTNVTQQGNRFDIGGGTQAGANLFHSFQQFGLDRGQIANFLSNPSIQNILSRVVGGDPSVINGLIQLTGGNSNLYIMNPAGIIFGANASLNVPAAFTATTANGIQVGNGWFGINTSVDAIKTLTGTPNSFGFANPVPVGGTVSNTTGGAIVNAGNLSVKEGQSITLVGGTVINTGTIAAPTGKITIAAVENGKYVRISQTGSLLSLDLPVADKEELTANSKPIQATDLPTLLTGRPDLAAVTGLSVNTLGQVVLPNSVAVPTQTGTAIASGNLDVSSSASLGGTIHILGTNVGLVGAKIDASGLTGGGTVLIGGDYQGKGTVPNAQFTYVSLDSTIIADALHSGNGGRVIAWADNKNSFYGRISALGGTQTGNGGFVEVSGKDTLVFRGSVSTLAPNGNKGTLLLDPVNITIQDGNSDGDDNGALTTAFGNNVTGDNGQVLIGDAIPTTIFESELEGIAAGTNVLLEASNNITIQPLVTDGFLTFSFDPGGSITFKADADNNGVGNFSMRSTDTINTGSRNLTISGANLSLGKIIAGSGNVTLTAKNDITTPTQPSNYFATAIKGANVVLTSALGNITTGSIEAYDTNTNVGSLMLTANNGSIVVNGYLQAGYTAGVTPVTDSPITISAGSFRAINPITGPQNLQGGAANSIPMSIVAFTGGQPNNAASTPPPRRIQLTLPNDLQPRILAGAASDPLIISITITKDTSFRFSKITPGGAIDPLPATGSGIEGAIGLGATNIPPNLLVLVSDQSFTANPSLTNASTGVLATTPTDGAVAAARTAEVQTASNIDTCDPDKDKKPALNVTASLPAPVSGGVDRGGTSGSSGQDGSRDAKAKLPPCK
ncbi:filamentous hemagglutinin N-terminal domain-containing protein [Tumidithrix elongata RA019]|uniref:Filamentous hemagglutinin N-terminal domain-containing protein n=1 Tax=Tumidithrix elongata BACA0141 TaxID=2716417 RepID=A0AAW9Q552_9CYAN|nr:filamentous hemagglutinin N-terminal domain-containing protein [Tumidithrix elongata RA019]